MLGFIQEISLPNKPQPINKILGSAPKLGRLWQKISKIKQLEERLRKLLPAPLNADHRWRVGNYRDQHLTLLTENSGEATRLRFHQRQFLEKARHIQVDIETISIKVLYVGVEPEAPVESAKRTLSAEAAGKISAAAEHIGDEALRASLLRLSRHGKGGPGAG